MINWFVKVAPIRQKMLVIVLIGTALAVVASVVPRVGEAITAGF